MANPYRTEATSLVRSCWPEATRPVGEMKFCYCGGEMTPPSQHDRGQWLRDGCPHALCHTEVASLANPYRSAATSPVSRWPEAIRLGYGSCHMALSKLWNVAGSSSGRNPVKLEPIAVDSDGDRYQTIAEIRTEIGISPMANAWR